MGRSLDLEFAADTAHFAEILDEILTASREVHGLLDIVPIDDERACIDLHAPIQERILRAQLIAPERVGRIDLRVRRSDRSRRD